MNRRNIIRGLAASALVPAIPAAALSLEERKREAVRLLADLPFHERLTVSTFSIAMSSDHHQYDYARELFDSGVPVSECHARVLERIRCGSA